MKALTLNFNSNFVPKVKIDNKPALVEIMAWRLTGDKPLSEPMMAYFTDTYMQNFVPKVKIQIIWKKIDESIFSWHNQV